MVKTGLRLFAVTAILLMSGSMLPASAHEGREVGEYVIEVGWRVEPAFAGQINGPEIHIEHHETAEPIEGAEETLQVEVLFGGRSVILNLEIDPEAPGHYTATLIPTRPGDYTFRVFGTLGETQIDESFSSADGQIATIEPLSDIQFPDTLMPGYDLEARITELEARITELEARLEE